MRHLESGLERSRLEPAAIRAVQEGNLHSCHRMSPDRAFGDGGRFIGGVVQNLDLQELARIVQLAHGIDQPVRDVHLVVDRQLYRDTWQAFKRRVRHRMVILVLHVQVDEVVPVPPVYCENHQDEEIGRERERFERGHTRRSDEAGTICDYTAEISEINATNAP